MRLYHLKKILWLGAGTLFSLPFFAGATVAPCDVATRLCNPIKYPNITAFLLAIVDVAIQYGALLIVFFIVFAGFKFVTAQGNSEKVSDARKMLTWIVVGAFVLLGVYVIRSAICGTLNQLGVTMTCNEQYTPR
ncbi:MAG: hypothetical protein Q7R93_01540 [bacterium]|nr:hypothetical protein [bacterium]